MTFEILWRAKAALKDLRTLPKGISKRIVGIALWNLGTKERK